MGEGRKRIGETERCKGRGEDTGKKEMEEKGGRWQKRVGTEQSCRNSRERWNAKIPILHRFVCIFLLNFLKFKMCRALKRKATVDQW